ncbi:MAG: response regulator [Actinobacteria bacterium]|nr:MAG: response regulator [Actinomycetota bacterium]
MGQPEGRGRGVANILLVDDRPENLVALQAVLRPLGHNLVTAGSGEEALRRLLTEDFAVILLDVMMPGMDGFETAFQIKQRDRTRDVPIIFLTAISRDESDALQGFSSGAVDYVTKPYEGWMLRAKVQVFVELHQKTEQLKQQRELLATRLDQRFVEEARQLRKLADASLTLTSTLAVDSILDAVTEQARDIIGAHHAQTTVLLGEEADEAPRRTSVSLAVSPEYEGWAASREGVRSSPLTQTVWPRMRPMRVPRGQAASRPEGRALETVEPRHPALQGWLAVPLVGRNARVLGLLEVADKQEDDFSEADESILVQLAQLASVAIENAELFEREHELAETLQRSLLPQRLPVLAQVRLAARYLPAGGGGDVGGDWYDAIVLPGGQVVLAVGDVAGRRGQAASRPEGRALETVEPRHPALQGWLAVPLVGRNARVLGLLEVADKQEDDFSEADESILVQLAQLASVAIENAELFEREHELAETLQRSLLPQRLPVLAQVRLAARYLPAGGGGDVGGDWYDAIVLPGGQVVLAVGDVAGRGAQAAAVMGQLRIGMRAYALQGMDPADVLRSLDRLLQGLSAAPPRPRDRDGPLRQRRAPAPARHRARRWPALDGGGGGRAPGRPARRGLPDLRDEGAPGVDAAPIHGRTGGGAGLAHRRRPDPSEAGRRAPRRRPQPVVRQGARAHGRPEQARRRGPAGRPPGPGRGPHPPVLSAQAGSRAAARISSTASSTRSRWVRCERMARRE